MAFSLKHLGHLQQLEAGQAFVFPHSLCMVILGFLTDEDLSIVGLLT